MSAFDAQRGGCKAGATTGAGGGRHPDRPSPAPALQASFDRILRTRMQGLPMVNPALVVEAVGFRPWADHWLGVLVTPWFMSLWLMPRCVDRWQASGARETRHWVFPAGVFGFIAGHEPGLGEYQACSLFSPMFDFASAGAARAVALAALQALFERPGEVGAVGGHATAHALPLPRPLGQGAFLPGAATQGRP